ncbi:hypothetical protein [Prauserella muralis]|uniref:Uncharacterized protein n=1 Tax=Prauserella muralis TaxID=588067 RepID=A0A2V4BA59_9PSEU|nr:hypothetical protein [Prauserella muralis]PXY31941.1 hypothetical protein BAY60_06340 [Prauserella muralis]TWE13634.1 hypothetical protein FHX69_5758 [Prauserella muralis]
MTCKSCLTGLDHCHGTLVRHTDGGADCTDQGCADLDIVRHDLVIECHTIEGGCGCADEPASYVELPWAS